MKALSIFLLVFSISFAAVAQNTNYRTTALSFSFNGFNLGSYYGGVGGRLWISGSTVLNASIGGSISETKYDPTGNYTSGLNKTKYLNIGFGFEKHFDSDKDLSPYYSARLSVGISDQYYRPSNIQDYSYESIDKSNSFNLDFGFGIEYWILDRISLSGQHLFNVSYLSGKRTIAGRDLVTQDLDGFGVNLGTTSLMLSIYF